MYYSIVTGGAGFIGSHVAERLLSLGHAVSCIDTLATDRKRKCKELLTQRGAQFIEFDLRANAPLPLERIPYDFVFHLAGQQSFQGPIETYISDSVAATNHLLDYASTVRSIKLFVNISTSAVYGNEAKGGEDLLPNPVSPYAIAKYIGEQNAFLAGMIRNFDVCALRLFSAYGPRDHPNKLIPGLLRSALSGEPFPLYEASLDDFRSFTYIADIVDAVGLTIQRHSQVSGETFNIGHPSSCSVREIVNLVQLITRSKINIEIVSRPIGQQLATQANIEKARTVLLFNPKIDVRNGIELTWQALKRTEK